MDKYLPVLIVGAIIGIFTIAFLVSYARLRRNKEMQEFQRNMPDRVIIRRLLAYARPYWKQFVVIFIIMLSLTKGALSLTAKCLGSPTRLLSSVQQKKAMATLKLWSTNLAVTLQTPILPRQTASLQMQFARLKRIL